MRFTLSVQARSALRLAVEVTQHSRTPGSPGLIRAILTDSGVPLADTASVHALVTAPDGNESTLPLLPVEAGVFRAQLPTTVPGVYRILVRATGADLRGVRFTREELRTLAVWARGDEPPPLVIEPAPSSGSTLDLCHLLLCLLRDDGVRQLLERHEIDADRVAGCVQKACSDHRGR